MRNNLLPISKYGFKYIGYAFGAFFLFMLVDAEFLAFVAFVSMVATLYLFRNPERESVVFEQGSVVSPVDGIVKSIDEIKNGEYAYKVTIATRYTDVGILRTPLDGKVISSLVVRGTRLPWYEPLAQKLNEVSEVVFQNKDEKLLKVEHRTNRSCMPLAQELVTGQELRQGVRYGMAVDTTTTLYLPQNFRLNIAKGQSVQASQTLVGYFS